MKRILTLYSGLFLISGVLNAQGIIINEISQGSSGTKEFVEFIVVGSTAQSTGTVDLRDWIIDDNNGDFKLADNSAPGLASGHGRFAPSDTMAAVPVGALIVIYNVADINPNWNFIQTDGGGNHIAHIENGGMLYYIPGNSTLIRACHDFPDISNPGYSYVSSTVPPTISNWNDGFGFTNNGDAIQVRRPNGALYHGFGFSTPTQANIFTTLPLFPDVNLPSFNAYTGNAAGKVTYFDCGSWYYATNYLTGNATTSLATTTETPGLPNTINNANQITKIQNGVFNYALLNTDVSCSVALPLNLLFFKVNQEGNKVQLKWQTAKEDNNGYFEIERSKDQKQWMLVAKISADIHTEYYTEDRDPFNGQSFYRLKQTANDQNIYYSNVIPVYMQINGMLATIYPNPVLEKLHISTNAKLQYVIYNSIGMVIKKGYITSNEVILDLKDIAAGFYLLELKDTIGNIQKTKLLKL